MEETISYELAESDGYSGEWRVEAIGPDGEVYVSIFSGPKAKERAAEYAEWKNARRSAAVLELVSR
jgi:hypothetical protein